MLPGETILSGASRMCSTCKLIPKLGVYRSGAGYYVGTYCNCGPYSRESDYYDTMEAALKDLPEYTMALEDLADLPSTARTTKFSPGELKVTELKTFDPNDI
jgi:hypothetical protein